MEKQKKKITKKRKNHKLTREHYLVALIIATPILNYLGSFIGSTLGLPLFFDSLGTVLGVVLGGFWVGAFGGTVYNIITFFVSREPSTLIWAFSSLSIAFIVWYLIKSKKLTFESYESVFQAGLILAVINSIITSLISIFYFGGQETFFSISALQDLIASLWHSDILGIFLGHLLVELLDKSLVLLAAFGIYKIVRNNKLHRARTLVFPLSVLAAVLIFTFWMNGYKKMNDSKLDKDFLIKYQTQQAVSMLETVYEGNLDGMYSCEEAKKLGASLLRNLRYGDKQEGYFWADTSEGTNVVLYGRKDVEGKNRIDSLVGGVYHVREIIANGKKPGGGFTDYFYPRKDGSTPLAKRGYSLYFEPFDWIVGTGYYLEDVER